MYVGDMHRHVYLCFQEYLLFIRDIIKKDTLKHVTNPMYT